MSAELNEADLPTHPDPHAWTWTDAEKRAILRWGEELLATRATPAPGAPEVVYVDTGHLREVLAGNDMPMYATAGPQDCGLTALYTSSAPGAPAGFKLVPIRPTMGQLKAGGTAVLKTYCSRAGARPDRDNLSTADVAYRAMLDASPGAPGQEAAEDRQIIATYDKLHEGKLGAHWLWCVIEQIAAGVPETEAFKSFGYYEAGPSRKRFDAARGAGEKTS